MNNNEIKNPKTEVPTGTNFNDKDYMNCFSGPDMDCNSDLPA